MSLRLAVFDIAGTTVADQRNVAKAFRRAFQLNGFDIEEDDMKPLMGYKKKVAIQALLEIKNFEFNKNLVGTIHDDFVNEMMDFYEYAPDVRPMPDAEDIFLQIKEKGIRIALNTGFSKNIADTIVKRFAWREKELIDDVIASDEVEQGRPHPFMIRQLMFRAGVDDPREVMKIGDTEVDVIEGRNAGCGLVVAVTTGAYTREQLQQHTPDHIIDSLSELPGLIN